MAVSPNSIVTPQRPRCNTAVAVTANSTYSDAPTNAVTLIQAGANGARITRVVALPRATVTATQLQIYRDGDGTGSAKRLFNSALMAAYTMAQTTAVPVTDFGYSDDNPLLLLPNENVYAAIGVSLAGGIAFTADGADY